MMTTVSFEHLPNKEETMPRSNVNLVINDLAILPSSSRSLEGFNKFMQEQLEANVEGLCLINARVSQFPQQHSSLMDTTLFYP